MLMASNEHRHPSMDTLKQPLLSFESKDRTSPGNASAEQPLPDVAADAATSAGRTEPVRPSTIPWVPSLAVSWITPLVRTATARQLQAQDLPLLPEDMRPGPCGALLWELWLRQQDSLAQPGTQENQSERQQGSPAQCSGEEGSPGARNAEEQSTGGGKKGKKGPPASDAPSLFWPLLQAFGWEYVFIGFVIRILGSVLGFLNPVLMNLLLTSLSSSPGSSNGVQWKAAVGAAIGLGALSVVGTLIGNQYGLIVSRASMRTRGAIATVVFRKALGVRVAQRAAFSSGEIQTLMLVDAERVVQVVVQLHEFWAQPLAILTALWLLYWQLRSAFLAGLAVMLLIVPVNKWLATQITTARERMLTHKDERVRCVGEMLGSIQSVRAMGWEPVFESRITKAREGEMRALAVRKYLDALTVYFWACMPVLVSLATFSTFLFLGHELDAATVFTSIALLNNLTGPLINFPYIINAVLEAYVSVRRLQRFLRIPSPPLSLALPPLPPRPHLDGEKSGEAGKLGTHGDHGGFGESGGSGEVLTEKEASGAETSVARPPSAYTFQGGTFAVSGGAPGDEEAPTSQKLNASSAPAPTGGHADKERSSWRLHLPDLVIPLGAVVAVTGEVASGKTSLLLALLGELQRCTASAPSSRGGGEDEPPEGVGRSISLGSVPAAAALQVPWIVHASIRQNVVFGFPWDEDRYHAVLRACALDADLASLPRGDLTVVGEKGGSLSGGQRARLGLARALYSPAHVLYLDDPLAALDAAVARTVLKCAILGPLMRRRTCIVCTHHPEALASADLLLVLSQGRVVYKGPPTDAPPSLGLDIAANVAAAPASTEHPAGVSMECKTEQGTTGAGASGVTVGNARSNAPSGSQSDSPGAYSDANSGFGSAGGSPEKAPSSARQDGSSCSDSPGLYSDSPGLYGDAASFSGSAAGSQEGDTPGVPEGDESRCQGGGGGGGAEDKEGTEKGEGEGEAEARATGAVKLSSYIQYLRSVGWATLAVILVSMLLMQLTRNGADIWLSSWVDHPRDAPGAPPPEPSRGGAGLAGASPAGGSSAAALRRAGGGASGNEGPTAPLLAVGRGPKLPSQAALVAGGSKVYRRAARGLSPETEGVRGGWGSSWDTLLGRWEWLGGGGLGIDARSGHFLAVYAGIAALNSAVTLLRAFSFAYGGLRAARAVHASLLKFVAAAPMAFFDAHPVGQILNRFSSDLYSVDESVPFLANSLLAAVFQLAGVILTLIYSQWMFLFLLLALGWLYFHIQRRIRAATRDIRRLVSVARSPVYAGFVAALEGAPTVRAYACQARLVAENERQVEDFVTAQFAEEATNLWLGLRLALMSAFMVTAVGLAGVATALWQERRQDTPTLSSPYPSLFQPGHYPFLSCSAPSYQGGIPWVHPEGHAGSAGAGSPWYGPLDYRGLSPAMLAVLAAALQSALWRTTHRPRGGAHQLLSLQGSQSGAGTVGLGLSYAMPIVGTLNGVLGCVAGTEKEMVAVERVLQYTRGTPEVHPKYTRRTPPQEGPIHPPAPATAYTPAPAAPSDPRGAGVMPEAQEAGDTEPLVAVSSGAGAGLALEGPGSVSFCKVRLRYTGGGPLVLRDLSFDVEGGSMVAIAGRTGAGKSTILSALFRVRPLCGGSIRVDGVDIGAVCREALLHRLCLLPQTPLVFQGTIRENLDPFSQHQDADLWEALGDCHVAGAVRGLGGLEAVVGEVGGSLSAGQLQLLCLARVLLRKPKVLCLDECTANVDPATGAKVLDIIQRLSRPEGYKGQRVEPGLGTMTVLSVAHRIRTILAFKRVLVVEKGRVVEDGNPQELLEQEGSMFRGLAVSE